MPLSASIDKEEIGRFSRHTQDWWNPQGVWSPLHKINPARLDYVRQTVCAHFAMSSESNLFKRLSALDIGCGGGLMCEPLARLGAKVTGLDASHQAIDAAQAHATREKLKIKYIVGSVEDFAHGTNGVKPRSTRRGQAPHCEGGFDVILALEILEHLADIESFLRSTAALLEPDGIVIFSTINRTTKSYLLGVVAAEYVLGWVPVGMHDWNKFVRPSELEANVQKAGLALTDLTGMVYDPLDDGFSLRRGNLSVNYLASAVKQ
jgi:2-polyprenyl-6-hydroxyphenyl methylase/3-demethylubiquinone-9 3-methyltransferase